MFNLRHLSGNISTALRSRCSPQRIANIKNNGIRALGVNVVEFTTGAKKLNESNNRIWMWGGGVLGLSLLGLGSSRNWDEVALAKPSMEPSIARAEIPHTLPPVSGHAASLPVMSLAEFREGKCGRVWVALDGGVYDVTPFLDAHPGGSERIMMVQGQDLAKFWAVYQVVEFFFSFFFLFRSLLF